MAMDISAGRSVSRGPVADAARDLMTAIVHSVNRDSAVNLREDGSAFLYVTSVTLRNDRHGNTTMQVTGRYVAHYVI